MAKQHEIEYYTRLGEEGQRHAEGKPFSDAECGNLLIELGQIISLLPPPPLQVLDVGCGTGWTSEFVARAGYFVTGLDISPKMIEAANRLRSLENLKFIVGDFENITELGSYDVVLSFGALHHSDNLDAALISCHDVLKQNGLLVLMEPGEGHEDAETSRKSTLEYGLTERSLPPAFLSGALKSHGFGQIQIIPRLSLLNDSLSDTNNNWKLKVIQSFAGQRLSRIMQWFAHSRKVAIVTARAL